jgi:Fungal protein kinase
MAMYLDGQGTGAKDRTGTIAFMATSALGSASYTHQPIHDCESVFWLCALELLNRVGIEGLQKSLTTIASPGTDIYSVADAKGAVVSRLSRYKSEGGPLESYVFLKKPSDSSLFFCLTALMREFVNNNFIEDYYDAEEGFKDDCFDRCIKIIQTAHDAAEVQQVTQEIAAMSLPP